MEQLSCKESVMVKCVGLTLLFLLLSSPVIGAGNAQERGVGVGVILGEPTGLSAKFWTGSGSAIDLGLAYSFRSKGHFHIHMDYLLHFPYTIQSTERVPLYAGLGGRLAAGSGRGVFGLRLVGGIAYWPRSTPLEFFLELAPIVDLAPATELSANGGIGARFYFR
jgi:hypothetical protein